MLPLPITPGKKDGPQLSMLKWSLAARSPTLKPCGSTMRYCLERRSASFGWPKSSRITGSAWTRAASGANWGLAAGYSLSVMGLISSGFLIMHRHDAGGSILGGSTFLSLVTTFVYGSNSRSRENIEKARLLTGQQGEEPEEQ
jgi:hypothetical protein